MHVLANLVTYVYTYTKYATKLEVRIYVYYAMYVISEYYSLFPYFYSIDQSLLH